MLEKMDAFFEARLDGYEAHMLDGIKGAREFYPFTAALLPRNEGAQVLDLGCGTGLELEYYFAVNPEAHITGIDLSAGMLNALKAKFPGKQLRLICGSYFDADLGNGFDAAVSVESLHHPFPWHPRSPPCSVRRYRPRGDGGRIRRQGRAPLPPDFCPRRSGSFSAGRR